MTTPESTIKSLQEMAFETRKGGLYLKAARLFRQAGEIAVAHQDEESRIGCLFWEGACLSHAEKNEEALPLLMEAAASRSPAADPADIYNAATKTIEICLRRKPVVFCRKLIEQTQYWLETNRKEEWRHKLDCLAGELDFYHGDYETAYDLLLCAWNVWRDQHPCYTAVSHLVWLCKAAFRRKDIDNLRKWVMTIESTKKKGEFDKIFATESRLLLFRSERTPSNDFSVAADLAVSAIDHLEIFEGITGKELIPCLRILILASRWPDVERVLAKHPLGVTFDALLFLGDERLCRAREALGMEVRDDEYDTEFPDPSEKISETKTGLQFLSEAVSFYEQAMDEAGKEDDRLETDHYTKTLNERLSRVKRLETAVKRLMIL